MWRTAKQRRKHPARALILALVLDLVLAAGIVGADYIFNYRLPHPLPPLNIATASAAVLPSAAVNSELIDQLVQSGQATTARPLTSGGSWSEKFKSHFSPTVISTDTLYKSPHVSIELTHATYDSGHSDRSENGKHLEYGTKISYTLADIYVSDISCLQTAFAQDTYGVGYSEELSAMSARLSSVLAVNGDAYSNNRHQNNGTIIRNGVVYRTAPSTEETCVLYRDGSLKIFRPEEFNATQAIANGAWQSWVFGPSLLDENGQAKQDFLSWDYIRQSHPRTAIGYYEPGHYCLLVVDGRQADYSRGMFLEEMSQLCAQLGCTAAYNLDGGHSSFMVKGATVASHPYKPHKDIYDGFLICEPEV